MKWVDLHGVPDYFTQRERRPEVTLDPDNWAHGVFSALAVTLAEPLRKALSDHLERCVVCPVHGISRCPEGGRLFDLLPLGDRVIFG